MGSQYGDAGRHGKMRYHLERSQRDKIEPSFSKQKQVNFRTISGLSLELVEISE